MNLMKTGMNETKNLGCEEVEPKLDAVGAGAKNGEVVAYFKRVLETVRCFIVTLSGPRISSC